MVRLPMSIDMTPLELVDTNITKSPSPWTGPLVKFLSS